MSDFRPSCLLQPNWQDVLRDREHFFPFHLFLLLLFLFLFLSLFISFSPFVGTGNFSVFFLSFFCLIVWIFFFGFLDCSLQFWTFSIDLS